VTGQLFFALMVALSVVTTRRFRDPAPPEAVPAAATERGLSSLLVGALIVPARPGRGVLRHTGTGVLVHISMATLVAGLRGRRGGARVGLYGRIGTMRRAGQTLLALVAVQLTLGVGALAAVHDAPPRDRRPALGSDRYDFAPGDGGAAAGVGGRTRDLVPAPDPPGRGSAGGRGWAEPA